MDFRGAEARGTRDWPLDASCSLNGSSWLVDCMAMVHIAPPDAVEQLVFGCAFVTCRLPVDLNREGRERFDDLWALHPAVFYETRQPGTGLTVPVPRWQQAYGRDYRYSGNVNRALPIPPILEPYLAWMRSVFDARLNGLLLNWYDAELAHRIGPHRDSIAGLVEGTPIVTISLGAARMFRLSPAKGKGFVDFEAVHGAVFVVTVGDEPAP
jgi:alkylated DNA repair dioxygenase AlkB